MGLHSTTYHLICNIEEVFWCAGTLRALRGSIVDMTSTALGFTFEPSFSRLPGLAQQETTLACLQAAGY
jgi:hypothetical protein